MGLIFNETSDEQQEAMFSTLYVGQTWQFRYMRMKFIVLGILAAVTMGALIAVIDYVLIHEFDINGIIGYILNG